jgi:hypothetical protein
MHDRLSEQGNDNHWITAISAKRSEEKYRSLVDSSAWAYSQKNFVHQGHLFWHNTAMMKYSVMTPWMIS